MIYVIKQFMYRDDPHFGKHLEICENALLEKDKEIEQLKYKLNVLFDLCLDQPGVTEILRKLKEVLKNDNE